MSRSARVLLVVVAIGIAAVFALTTMARRYGDLLRDRDITDTRSRDEERVRERAAATTDLVSYVAVRREMRRAADSRNEPSLDEIHAARDRELEARQLERARYDEIHALYRAWRQGSLDAGHQMARAFEKRRAELSALDLRIYDPGEP